MKTTNYKCQQALQILLDINLLREDSYLFSKIALFQPDKKVRYKHYVELMRIEEERIKIEHQLETILDEMEINEFWKTYLFQFSNKIYKNIKNFHQKIVTFSNKIAQISETNNFLQMLRSSCIERLAESKSIRQFVHLIIQKLQERATRQFSILNNFGINNKTIELARREQNSKNNRYLNIIKPKDASLFHRCHQKSLIRLLAESQRLLCKQLKTKNYHPNNLYWQLMDLQEENVPDNNYQAINGMMISLAYLEQGFCEFITTKYYRIVKDLLNRNAFNEQSINRFREKYIQMTNKAKRVVKSNTVYDDYFKKSQKKQELSQQQQLSSSLGMKNITNLPNQKQIGTIEQQNMNEIPKKNNIFKIQKFQTRKKSHTLRPLAQSKENNKQVVHQKIIQMKLEEEPLQIAKILRIRKKKRFPIFREQNSWSIGLVVKENASKVSFLIH